MFNKWKNCYHVMNEKNGSVFKERQGIRYLNSFNYGGSILRFFGNAAVFIPAIIFTRHNITRHNWTNKGERINSKEKGQV